MNEKITIRIAAALTALILVLTAVTPAYAAGDTTIPTLTAVVNNGMLTVDATDDATGISAIYVNGFEFTDLTDGSLTIRMQQYDTGYQYFTMQAKDGAGNLSEVYRVNNPYYTFPDEDNGEEVEDPSLPTDANPTKPSNAEGEVTDHVKTDNHGNKTDRRSRSSSSTSSSSSSTKSSSSSTKSSSSSTKKSGVEEDDEEEDMEVDSASKITAEGREFYTIMTKTGKVFYLVIDRTKDEETVHFLTDITENDLLNATEDNKPTLPQNSAVVIKDAGLADMSAGSGRDGEEAPEKEEISVSEDSLLIDDAEEAETEEEVSPLKSFMRNNLVLILTLGISILAIIIYGAVKILGKDEDDDYEEDEEQEDEEDEEAYPDGAEDEEEKSSNDEFFDRADEDEREEEAPEKENTPEQAQQSSGKEEHTEEHKEEYKEPDKQPERETTAEVPVYTPYPERSQAPVTTPEPAQTVETIDPDEEEPEEDDQEL